MKYLSALVALATMLLPGQAFSQQKKPIEHDDVSRWKSIEQPRISDDGNWVAWTQAPVTEGDPVLYVRETATGKTQVFPRAANAIFTEDARSLVFRINPPFDTIKAMRRRKVKDEQLPKDSLAVLTLSTGALKKMPNLKSFTVPEKWSGWFFYQIEPGGPEAVKKDSSETASPDSTKAKTPPAKKKSTKKAKKENKENGYRLVICNMENGIMDTIAFVEEYAIAEKMGRLLLSTTGPGDTLPFAADTFFDKAGVYLVDLEAAGRPRPLFRGKGHFQQLSLNQTGTQAAFLADTDTTKARIKPWQLLHWAAGKDSAQNIAGSHSDFLPAGWGLSEHERLRFSDDDTKLYFGMAPPPVLNDTTLLPEEIVNVEVWAWTDHRLYTQQEARLEQEKKRAYAVVWHIRSGRFVPLNGPEWPELRMQDSRNANLALGFTEEPYAQAISWEGRAQKDLVAVDLNTGEKRTVATALRCSPHISSGARYIAWWSDADTAWYAWNARSAVTVRLTDNRTVNFFDDERDVPDLPGAYGTAGWLDDDAAILLYDRYDIWKFDPDGKKKPERMTSGRAGETVYRYLKLDPEQQSIHPQEEMLLHRFDRQTKSEGYVWLSPRSGTLRPWLGGDYAYTKSPKKARNADQLLFTREHYNTFPDLMLAGMPGGQPRQISDANSQQAEYRWGSIEPVQWTSLTGEKISGLLVKPDDFDPAKQYPMIVNFYEKVSDGLHRHRSPGFHRSQINWTVYASRGYLIFAPDIHYKTGYPGESAYDAIVSGVAAMIDQGFVDASRIGLQGHSWGGYQAAYLVTRTDMFACAEAGAPVANMTSAYGGIRWESGMSRAFQYERQQSRIGGSLWEYPLRYLENSPLFSLDKVHTPLLILHNDKDGAVPWYQGIELFSGLRRLGKPCWLLNYNNEPHWPVKLQNRIDFQKRMQQFFDHYLMSAPMPSWMQRGVPPLEKGILQGFETGG